MEFKLNKIDTELRNKINQATSEGKIHTKDNKLNINKDKDSSGEKQGLYSALKNQKGKKLLVDAIKKDNVDVEAFATDEKDKDLKGRFLDIRR